MDETTRVIIFDNKLYGLSEAQFEQLQETRHTAKNLLLDIPLGANLLIEEHIYSAMSEYKLLGNVDINVDKDLLSYEIKYLE